MRRRRKLRCPDADALPRSRLRERSFDFLDERCEVGETSPMSLCGEFVYGIPQSVYSDAALVYHEQKRLLGSFQFAHDALQIRFDQGDLIINVRYGRARVRLPKHDRRYARTHKRVVIRACANRLVTFRTWRLCERLNCPLFSRWHICYSPIGAASKRDASRILCGSW